MGVFKIEAPAFAGAEEHFDAPSLNVYLTVVIQGLARDQDQVFPLGYSLPGDIKPVAKDHARLAQSIDVAKLPVSPVHTQGNPIPLSPTQRPGKLNKAASTETIALLQSAVFA